MYSTRIGGTGLISSPIGLGCTAFTGSDGRIEEAESTRRVRQALDLGISMIDIPGSYLAGEIERLVGRAVGRRRGEAVIATRGGLRFNADGRPTGLDAAPDRLRQACDASLLRLGTDRIDLYYLAGVDPNVPVEESMGQLAELIKAGKICQAGLVTSSARQLRQAHLVHPVAAICGVYSLWERQIERECLPAARELGVALVACRPLGRGMLTGRIPSPELTGMAGIWHGTRFSEETLMHLRGLLEEAEEVAASLDVGLPRLALAWLLSQPGVVPVPSTRNPLHLEMNAAAVGFPLPPDQQDRLAELFPVAPFAQPGGWPAAP